MKQLPADTVRLITSTQVITSVISIVKELVENSLDAKATNIEIKMENFGFDRIEIRDDGLGISLDDIPYMGQKHFTSKIRQHDDLQHLFTYGFRGEALASLCAVSSVTIATKTEADPISMVYTLDQKGKVAASKPCHLGQGTTVTATNLFKNVPVRKQFYNNAKRKKDELRKVEEILMQFSVIKPQVRFVLRNDKTVVWQKNKVNNYKSALASIWGRSVVAAMDEVSIMCGDTMTSCFLPKPDADPQLTSRSANDRCWVFINDRPVMSKDIERTIKQCVQNCYPPHCIGRHPFAFINIQLPPDTVDVNLEPNKSKVLLHDKEILLVAIKEKLQERYRPSSTQDDRNVLDQKEEEKLVHNTSSYDKDDYFCGRDSSVEVVQYGNRATSELSVNQLQGVESRSSTYEIISNETNPEQASVEAVQYEKGATSERPVNQLQGVESRYSAHEIISNETNSEQASNESTYVNQNEHLDRSEVMESRSMVSDISSSAAPLLGDQYHSDIAIDDTCFDLLAGDLTDNAMMDVLESNPELCDMKTSSSTNEIAGLIESVNQISASEWSRGKGLLDNLGQPVEPVCILIPNSATNQEFNHYSNNSTSSINQKDVATGTDYHPATEAVPQTPSRERKPIDDKVGQASFYNLIGKTPIKRPQTAYIFFSKELRPQILQDNPTADFQTIAKMTGKRWKELNENDRVKYEEMRTLDVQRYKEQVKTAKEKMISNSEPSRKKQRLNQPPQQLLVDKLFTSPQRSPVAQLPVAQSHVAPHVKKSVEVCFSIVGLKKDKKQKERQTVTHETCQLIGRLPNGCWTCQIGDQLKVLNHYRVEETLLYHKLLAEHRLQIQNLEMPIRISPSMLGGDSNWQTLITLKSHMSAVDCSRTFTDDRLVANGFDIKQSEDPETGHVRLQVIGMATNIPCYGLADLAEILNTIGGSTDSCTNLHQCRPIKLVHYLQGEAVRLARDLPHLLSHDDITNMLERQRAQLSLNLQTCMHSKCFYQVLHVMNGPT